MEAKKFNAKLEAIFEKLLNDEALVKEFMSLETMDEMFEYCQSQESDFTRQDFDDYIASMLEGASEAGIIETEELDKEDLEKIIGGKALPKNIAIAFLKRNGR